MRRWWMYGLVGGFALPVALLAAPIVRALHARRSARSPVFVENRSAGDGVREFRNTVPLSPPPGSWPDLRHALLVRQVGSRDSTGVMRRVDVFYRGGGRRTVRGWRANKLLRRVQANRADA